MIALGQDPYEDDPYEELVITTTGLAIIAAEIARLKIPTLLVYEGGYLSSPLGDNLNSFFGGFENN